MWNISRKLSLLFIFDMSSPWKKKKEKKGEKKEKKKRKKMGSQEQWDAHLRAFFFLIFVVMYARNISRWWKKYSVTKEIFFLSLDKLFRLQNNTMTRLIMLILMHFTLMNLYFWNYNSYSINFHNYISHTILKIKKFFIHIIIMSFIYEILVILFYFLLVINLKKYF